MSKSIEYIKFILQSTAGQFEKNGSYQPTNPVAYAQGLREVLETIEELFIQQEADAKDATRYRWLRGKIGVSDWGSITLPCGSSKLTKEETDSQIDTAMVIPTYSEEK